MNRTGLLDFIRPIDHAVMASVHPTGSPQAAVVGIVVSDALEIFFDTSNVSRKCLNLRARPKIAFVIGWDDAQTAQVEGIADEPTGEDLARLKKLYFARFAEGPAREKWPDITYFRVRVTWARYSDFRGAQAQIVEVPI